MGFISVYTWHEIRRSDWSRESELIKRRLIIINLFVHDDDEADGGGVSVEDLPVWMFLQIENSAGEFKM